MNAKHRHDLATVLVLFIIGAALLFGSRAHTGSQSGSTTIPTLSQGRLLLTGQCSACSYDNSLTYSLAQQEQDISMLKGLGFTSIRIDLGYDAWLKNNQTWISKESQVISYVKSQGLTLIIADASAESYRSNPLPWTQFKEAWAQRVETIAQFQPNYYLVIKEPGWYVGMVSDYNTNPLFISSADWDNLSGWLAGIVQSESPSTVIGVSVSASGFSNQPTFYNPFLQNLPSPVAIIGIDTYGTNNVQAMETFIQSNPHLRTYWNAEWWSQASASSDPSTDPAALATQYNLCVQLGISEIDPFYSSNFAAYPPAIVSNFVASTPVAQEMQKISQVNG